MKKIILGTFTVVLSTGLLFGCGTANDETELNSTEAPSEQQEDLNQNDNKTEHQEDNKE